MFFHKIGQIAVRDQLTNLRMRATVFVLVMFVLMAIFVFVGMFMPVPVMMPVFFVVMLFFFLVRVRGSFVDAKLDSLDLLLLLAREVHVEIADVELRQFPLEGAWFHAEVGERADGHVAADAGKTIEKENTHAAKVSSRLRGTSENRKSPLRWKRRII